MFSNKQRHTSAIVYQCNDVLLYTYCVIVVLLLTQGYQT